MPKLPEKIEVITDRKGRPKSVEIDGKEFPWYLAKEAEIFICQDELPTITLTIPATEIFMRDDHTKIVEIADTQSLPIVDVEPGHAV